MLERHNVYFMKKDFTEKQAQDWIKSHNYKLKKKNLKQHHPTEWRYNQVPKQNLIRKVMSQKYYLIRYI